MAPLSQIAIGAILAASGTLAHPGHSVQAEAAERAEFFKRSPKSIRSCAPQLESRGLKEASLARRQELAGKARAKHDLAAKPMLSRRDFAAYNFSHEATEDIKLGGHELNLFEDNSSCVLQPEVTQGPYYIDGELIRKDIVEDQEGVPLYLDIQLIDTSTCEPVPAVYMDIWHCNSTGVYSGVTASGNGNENDDGNLDNTFLRGIQPSDSNGIVQFETIFPGHYTGRANHIHMITHNTNSTIVRTNGTLLGSNFTTQSSHVGQMFFDQDLISTVEKTAPYSTNTQELTKNADDDILASEAADMDPFVEYVFLGEDVSDGILAWLSIG
ncbi:aromatic compound dioxygenase, partial [Hortaea werneckii]